MYFILLTTIGRCRSSYFGQQFCFSKMYFNSLATTMSL